MMGENSKVELVDKLREEFEQAIKTYREHLHADRIDLLKEDDKVWKEKEKAWREQLEKVYPSYHKATEITENSDQLHDKLETMAVEFTCEPEVPEEPDDLENDFNAAEVQWNQFAAVTQLQASLDQLARGWGKYPKVSTKNEYEGDYIVNTSTAEECKVSR